MTQQDDSGHNGCSYELLDPQTSNALQAILPSMVMPLVKALVTGPAATIVTAHTTWDEAHLNISPLRRTSRWRLLVAFVQLSEVVDEDVVFLLKIFLGHGKQAPSALLLPCAWQAAYQHYKDEGTNLVEGALAQVLHKTSSIVGIAAHSCQAQDIHGAYGSARHMWQQRRAGMQILAQSLGSCSEACVYQVLVTVRTVCEG